MEQFPPNSRKAAESDQKRVEQVTSAAAVRRRPSLGKQFRHTFIGGDARTAVEYMIGSVIIPSAKEMLVEAMSSGFERLIYGESRPRRGASAMQNMLGHVQYNRMSPNTARPPMGAQQRPTMSRQARARFDFDEIVITTRQDAEEVLDRLYDLVSRYGEATVADLYDLTGVQAQHTDQKWGWRNLRGSSVGRVRNMGYMLNLPDPEPLD